MNATENLIPAILAADVAAEVDMARRFGGIGRLYGPAALERFQNAHVCVIGVGGVGSWIVEALARSAIGELTLIDLDNVSESNINRQIMAMSDTIGMPKIDALAERILQINPYCKLNLVEDFIGPENVEQMLGGHGFDYVIDAIDSVKAKAAVIAWCRDHAMPIVTIGSAGGKTDPGKIALRDLARTEQEPLLKMVRKKLRNQYGFPRGEKHKFHIDAVFSMETLTMPEGDGSCSIDGSLNCAGFGSAMVVTATFGMFAAGHALRRLADGIQAATPVAAADAVQAEEAALS